MEDTDSEDLERDFIKNSKNIETLGFRDGIMDGKENLSQGSFDCGYLQGFKMGLALGFCNEILSLVGDCDKLSAESQELITNKSDDALLKNEEKGHCVVCDNSHSEDAPLKIVADDQKNTNDKIIADIERKYAPLLNEIDLNEATIQNIFITDN